MINYEKTESIIKSEVNSGIGNNKYLCVEFKDRQGKRHIFTVLNTSWGKKGNKRTIYYNKDNPKKLYAINWSDFVFPSILLVLSVVFFVME
jgi:hypothetical protein